MPCPCFHKLILLSTIQSRELRIPDVFLRKIRAELSAISVLTVPDGNVWRIGLRKVDKKIWLHDGWQNFVERYSIRVGYLLLFRYEGNSSFNVHIFNLASEINYQSAGNAEGPYFAKQHHNFEEMEDEDSEVFDSSLQCMIAASSHNKVLGGSVDQLTPAKTYNPPALQNLFNGSKLDGINWVDGQNLHSARAVATSQDNQLTRDIGVQFNEVEFKRCWDEIKLRGSNKGIQRIRKTVRKKQKTDPSMQPSAQHVKDVAIRFRFYESASARKRTVTAEERERVINAAKAFEPPNPFCRVVLRPSYLYRGCIMYLPSCFAEKHLNEVSGFIKLQISDGRQWPVRCLYRGGRAKLSQGWYEFSLENNLGEGDVCVFELLNMKDVVLHVTVFHVAEDPAKSFNHPFEQNVRQTKLFRN